MRYGYALCAIAALTLAGCAFFEPGEVTETHQVLQPDGTTTEQEVTVETPSAAEKVLQMVAQIGVVLGNPVVASVGALGLAAVPAGRSIRRRGQTIKDQASTIADREQQVVFVAERLRDMVLSLKPVLDEATKDKIEQEPETTAMVKQIKSGRDPVSAAQEIIRKHNATLSSAREEMPR